MWQPKGMRPIAQLLSEYNKKDNDLTLDELRLVDRVMFEKTGQHIRRFRTTQGGKPTTQVPSISHQNASKQVARVPSYARYNGPSVSATNVS